MLSKFWPRVVCLILLLAGLTLGVGQTSRVEAVSLDRMGQPVGIAAAPAQQNLPRTPGLVVSEVAKKDVLPALLGAEPIPLQPPKTASPAPQQGPPPQLGQIGYLSGPAAGDPLDIALNYIRQNKST